MKTAGWKMNADQLSLLKTPCFIFDRAALKQNLQDFQQALQQHWGRAILAYSVKTNPLPWVMAFARSQGCYAEVVSDAEYQLALRLGYPPAEIVFNGPIKGREQLYFALEKGSIVNLDSMRELEWTLEYARRGAPAAVGVRVNFNLENCCPGETVAGPAGSRFGFCDENETLAQVIRRLQAQAHVRIAGLHMHFASRTRSLKLYQCLAQRAVSLIRQHQLQLDYFDIGGGFFGGGPNTGAYARYVQAIAEELRPTLDPQRTTLIVEPGGAVICTPGYYAARVIDVKETDVDRFVITEAGRKNIYHELKKDRYVYSIFSQSEQRYARQVICGYTCMETDRLFVLENERALVPGDLLVLHNAGAYSLAFTPLMFIDYPPVVYVRESDGSFTLVRDRWTADEYLQKNILTP